MDKFETQGLDDLFECLLGDEVVTVCRVVPLLADVLYEGLIVGEVDVEVVVEGHEFLLGQGLLGDGEQRNQLLQNVVFGHFSVAVDLDAFRVELLDLIMLEVPRFSGVSSPILLLKKL